MTNTAQRGWTPSPRCLILVALLIPLLGCAALGPPARPADFPFHATEQLFNLHWRLDREAGAVTAVGVVEVGTAADRVGEVLLELRGIDSAGRIVSRGFDRARPMAFSGDVTWPFAIRLRPRGQEDRFTVTVSDVTWRALRTGGR